MNLAQLMTHAVQNGASDVFIITGLPVTYKIQGRMVPLGTEKVSTMLCSEYLSGIYASAEGRDMRILNTTGDDDFSFSLPGVSRFRVSAYKQRGSFAAVIRVVNLEMPDPQKLGLPESVLKLSDKTKGMILATGPAGSGKSTTLACIIDRINATRQAHIITLEDPLEYLHRHKRSIVSQREIESDTESYVKALRAALRQSPDVILVGEMRDLETIQVAMTAAETGHLVISTLHTIGAANTIDRIVDVFPSNQQHQIRVQLSMVLQAVISQQLVPTADGRIAPAFEIMIANNAIRNMIREGKVHQIDTVIQSSAAEGMITMDTSLSELVRTGRITERTAMHHASNSDVLSKKLRGLA
ncbi:MAG: type IV pilus twitching motility protein PilT [Oscillospiraceae bacterium]|nr:type IV pilus twitching motility protein PilT [Oscillospiraceae bacterium]